MARSTRFHPVSALAPALLLAACGGGGDAPDPVPSATATSVARPGFGEPSPAPAPSPSATASPAPDPAATAAATGRTSRFTQLTGCPLIESAPDEAGYYLYRCPGTGGYQLRHTLSDGRESLAVQPPGAGGDGFGLKIPEIAGAGFGELGDRVEWRGGEGDGDFRPDALVLRYRVAEDPNRPTVHTSYLLAARIRPGSACITARIPPGPDQNARAQAAADEPEARCLQ